METDAHFSKIIAQESVLSHIVNIGIEQKIKDKVNCSVSTLCPH